MSSEANTSPRMEKGQDPVAKKVLKLTLEIIYLLTGEDYGPIKNSTSTDGDPSATLDSDSPSLKEERKDKKILEAINQISVLLTGEVPVRCEDVTVAFSLEEWEYLEGHANMYCDVIMEDQLEDQLPVPPPEGPGSPNADRSLSPLPAQDHPEDSVGLPQLNEEENDVTQGPKDKDGGLLQAVINDLQRVSKHCRQDAIELPRDHKQEVGLFPKDSKMDGDHIPKDSRQEADRHPKDNKQDLDQIQRDCRQEIDLIRQICRQEVETILKDCKREIERIQKDYRPEVNCSSRECKQEAIPTANRQEAEGNSGNCKQESDPVQRDCKREADLGPRDCRLDADVPPKDCKKETEQQIPSNCRWNSGPIQKDWKREDNEVHVLEEEPMKDVKIEILSDDEWNDEEWDVQYKDDDDDLIYIDTDDSSPENTPEKSTQPVYVDRREEDFDSPQAYQRPVRPEERASSSANNSNTQMIPKNQPNVGTSSPAALNSVSKRVPVPQRTFSPGQMESVAPLGTPPAQEYSQTGQQQQQQQQKNINTARKTTSDIQTLQNFLSEFNENRKVEEIPHTELDTLLSKFLLVVKRKDGNEYEPHTLRCMVGSIDRYLKEHHYMHTIVYGNSKDFPLTKQSLNAKIKFLKKIAESNPPSRQEALTDDDIENLYKSGTLSMDNPTSLLNLVFFNNGLHFALRTKEQYNLQWGDIRLKIDPRGNQYLEYTDRQTEIVENRKSSRHIKPRMYATPHTPDKDPVTAYLKYRSFRPSAMMVQDAPFYLAPNVNYNPAFSEWYRSTKIGIQKIRAMMTTMKIRASLPESKKKVGYMTKKRLVERLPQHLLTAQSSSTQTPSNNMRSGINHAVASELMHHKMPANIPTTVASQPHDPRFTSSTFQPRPSTSRYGEPPPAKRSFPDGDMVQHHGTMLQRNPALYLNSYAQVMSDESARKRKIAGYDFKSQ
ncbi:uncharacterized protein PAF06_001270 [Gastrophryne carolinensis]